MNLKQGLMIYLGSLVLIAVLLGISLAALA
jgi:hypothetical protein